VQDSIMVRALGNVPHLPSAGAIKLLMPCVTARVVLLCDTLTFVVTQLVKNVMQLRFRR